MTPVLEYRERRLGSRRDFTLGDDAVSVRGRTFLLSEFDATIPLKALLPAPSRARIRTPTVLAGFAVILVSLFWALFLLGCFPTVAGLMAGLAVFRKVEFVQFQKDAGLTVLDIARAGPDAASLDAFVAETVRRIRQLRGSA